MIYTLNILTERVIRALSGGDIPDDSPYDPDFVRVEIIDAMREDLKLEILTRRNGGTDDRSPVTQYIATFKNVEVKIDRDTLRAYIDLPSSYMSLKYNKAVMISPMKQPNNQMIPVANPSVTSKLPHADLERLNYGFYTEGQQVFFMRDIKNDKIVTVLLKLIVPAPDTLGYDDPLPLLPDNVGRILDVVKKRVANPFQQDRLNDGDPNLRPTNV